MLEAIDIFVDSWKKKRLSYEYNRITKSSFSVCLMKVDKLRVRGWRAGEAGALYSKPNT